MEIPKPVETQEFDLQLVTLHCDEDGNVSVVLDLGDFLLGKPPLEDPAHTAMAADIYPRDVAKLIRFLADALSGREELYGRDCDLNTYLHAHRKTTGPSSR